MYRPQSEKFKRMDAKGRLFEAGAGHVPDNCIFGRSCVQNRDDHFGLFSFRRQIVYLVASFNEDDRTTRETCRPSEGQRTPKLSPPVACLVWQETGWRGLSLPGDVLSVEKTPHVSNCLVQFCVRR